MVRTLIRREFRVSLSAVSVGRLLRTLGLSPQRPLWRAWQADADAVQRWKDEQFPAIRKQAKADGCDGVFRRRGWAALGLPRRHDLGPGRADAGGEGHRRPAQPEHDLRGHRAGAAAVLHLHRQLHRRPVHRVLPQADGRHRRAGVPGRRRPPRPPAKAGQRVRRLHRGSAAAVRAARLLPQLNPDEWVWKNVKHDRVGRTSVADADEFKTKIIGALRRLQKLPHIVRAFFADPDLRYITA